MGTKANEFADSLANWGIDRNASYEGLLSNFMWRSVFVVSPLLLFSLVYGSYTVFLFVCLIWCLYPFPLFTEIFIVTYKKTVRSPRRIEPSANVGDYYRGLCFGSRLGVIPILQRFWSYFWKFVIGVVWLCSRLPAWSCIGMFSNALIYHGPLYSCTKYQECLHFRTHSMSFNPKNKKMPTGWPQQPSEELFPIKQRLSPQNLLPCLLLISSISLLLICISFL